MVRPSGERVDLPPLPAGYRLRYFADGDERAYEDLFALAWPDRGTLDHARRHALDAGFVVIEHADSRQLVASCVAFAPESPERHPAAGSLGWLVTDPAHGRRGLATIAAATVTNRLVDARYALPWLGTEDDRLTAIAIYLRLGWRPYLHEPDMEARWRAIAGQLGREFSPDDCVRP